MQCTEITPHSQVWKNYCPQNWSLVLKRLGTTSLVYSQLLLFAIGPPPAPSLVSLAPLDFLFFCWC